MLMYFVNARAERFNRNVATLGVAAGPPAFALWFFKMDALAFVRSND